MTAPIRNLVLLALLLVIAFTACGEGQSESDGQATSALASNVTINFEPATAPVPTGDQADTGAVYTASRGYGWSVDLTGNTRARNTNADQRLDTFVYSANLATWTGDLANGNYLVSLASGDAAWAQGPHRVVVEGVVAINDVSTAVNQYLTVTDLPVSVADGKLTVQIGGAGG